MFLVFPRFARKHHYPALPVWIVSLVASGLAVYGLVLSFKTAGS